MHRNRRQSVRVPVTLPCEWQFLPERVSPRTAATYFTDSIHQPLLAALDEIRVNREQTLPQFNTTRSAAPTDPALADAVAVLDQKLNLLIAHLCHSEPALRRIEISHDGVALNVEKNIEKDIAQDPTQNKTSQPYIVFHACLPQARHFFASGKVVHEKTDPGRDGEFSIGVCFEPGSGTNLRDWNRFVLNSSHAATADTAKAIRTGRPE